MKIEYRPFACDKCETMHSQQTNHEGQIYNVKCKNWPCTAGALKYTTMTYWGGETEEYETSFLSNESNGKFVILTRKKAL